MKRMQSSERIFFFVLALVFLVSGSATAQDAGSSSLSVEAGASVSTSSPEAGVFLTSGAGGSDAGSRPILSEGPDEPVQPTTPPREDPSPQQIEALRLLEAEIAGFSLRGEAFRRSVNGLLTREHDTQLDQIRRGYERQISAERDAEAVARRRAIEVFERFLEQYPNDPDHTPDVMFRLAELYYDEAAYAKLEADALIDTQREQREAAGQSTDDLIAPPVDYRCSILLYRHVLQRFTQYRNRDTTHYLLGWVLKEMGREDESITAYRALVCPGRYRYSSEFDLAAPLVQGRDTPPICPRMFALLTPIAPEIVTPVATPGATVGINAGLTRPGEATDSDPMPIPQDYAQCVPLNAANGRPSRYAAEAWYYVGDYHFDNPPSGDGDLGNAYAIAAYEATMRASETRNAAAVRAPGTPPPSGLQGTSSSTNSDPTTSNTGSGVTAENSPGRAQFNRDITYGPFWSKALYKIGWSYFRMLNGYPRALQGFSRLLDFYDYVGGEIAAQGNRQDTIKWIGVIFSENTWGVTSSNDAIDCQQLVETVARPPVDAVRPFDCAGIMRIASPLSPVSIMAQARGTTARPAPIAGRPTYIPQDRPWTPEAYLELANDYFQQTKYYEAITLYRVFLQLYPMHFQAPRVAENIALAYERQRQFEAAVNARGEFVRFTEQCSNPPCWWDANNTHPDAQRYAEMIARNSLHDVAIQHHRNAALARIRAVTLRNCAARRPGGDVCQAARNARETTDLTNQANEQIRRANAEYGVAIEAYDRFIQNYPNDEDAYEFRYNRADAMYWAERFADAARAYAEVRESNENDTHLVGAAYMAIKSQEAALRGMVARREIDACLAVRAGIPAAELRDANGAPLLDATQSTQCADIPRGALPAGSPPSATAPITELNIPEVVQTLMQARVSYTGRVPRSLDSARGLEGVFASDGNRANEPPFRPKYAYINARTLMRFGHLAEAEAKYRQILQTYCNDPVVGAATAIDLRNILVIQNRNDDLEALARQQAEGRTCGGGGSDTGDVFRRDLTNARFRHALEIFNRASQAQGAEAQTLYETAANEMRTAVETNRGHPQAPLALYYTALAYERTNRFDTATQTYIRVTQDFNNTNVNGTNPPEALTGDALDERINILETSNFRAAVNLERTFDYPAAIRYYNEVATNPRYNSVRDRREHDGHVHDALATIALINTNLGNWDAARTGWRNFLPRAAAGREHATAEYRISEMSFRARDWRAAIRDLQGYRSRVAMSPESAEFHVQAQYNIATAYKNLNNQTEYRRALRAVATVFEQSHQPAASRAAAFAAEALFADLDQRTTDFSRRALTAGTGEQLATQIRTIKTELDQIDQQAQQIVALSGGEYSIAALVRRGMAHEYLATQEVRISQLFQFSRQQQQNFARLEAAIRQLRSAADQLDNANQPDRANQLRDRAQTLEDQVTNQRDTMTREIQERYDHEAEAERKLAIQDYAIAIHLARRDNIPTRFASEALEHIRLEENRPLMEGSIQALRPEVTQAARFSYRPGMFDTEAPGITLLQQNTEVTPGLASDQ